MTIGTFGVYVFLSLLGLFIAALLIAADNTDGE